MEESEVYLVQTILRHGEDLYISQPEEVDQARLDELVYIGKTFYQHSYLSLTLLDGTEVFVPQPLLSQCIYALRILTPEEWEAEQTAVE